MKQSQLEKILRKVVKEAVREEVKSILNEAVLIASSPTITEQDKNPASNKDLDWKTQEQPGLSEMLYTSKAKPKKKRVFSDDSPLGSVLEQTRQSMTPEESAEIMAENAALLDPSNLKRPQNGTSSTPGVIKLDGGGAVDMGQLDFIKKAKTILDKSNEKDKQRFG